MKKHGFTLIETVIYIGLFSFMLGGMLQSAFALMQSADVESANVQINEEMSFVMHKIDWMLSGVQDIQSPTGLPASYTLKIAKYNFAFNPLTLSSQNGVLTLSRGSGGAVPLTTSNVTLDKALFTYITPDPLSGMTAGVQIVITLHGQTATSTYYVQ